MKLIREIYRCMRGRLDPDMREGLDPDIEAALVRLGYVAPYHDYEPPDGAWSNGLDDSAGTYQTSWDEAPEPEDLFVAEPTNRALDRVIREKGKKDRREKRRSRRIASRRWRGL